MTAVTTRAADRPRALPPAWRWAALAVLGPLTDGDWILNQHYADAGIRLLQVGDVGRGDFRDRSSRHISEQTARDLGCTLLKPGDILISRMPDPLGRACRLPDLGYPCITAVDVSIWRPSPSLADPDYLTYYLASSEWLSLAASKASGATRPRISRKVLEALPVPLPPLSEQKRIAAALREQLGAAARLRAATDAEAESMRALATATLEDLLQGPLRCGCAAQKCGDIALVTGGIQKSPLRLPQSFHRPFLTVRNVKRGYLDLSDVERMELTPAELKRLMLRAGDLLVVEGNGSRDQIGRNALFRGEIDECIHQNHVIRLRVDEGTLRPEFLSLYLNSRDGMAQLLQRAMTTTGLYTLSVRKIQSLDIPLPDLSQQDGILREWNRLQHELGRGTAAVKSQAVAAQELPVALLRRAFFG